MKKSEAAFDSAENPRFGEQGLWALHEYHYLPYTHLFCNVQSTDHESAISPNTPARDERWPDLQHVFKDKINVKRFTRIHT
ncbi:hypothetical protein F9K33_07510 [bacterium]|nr:MAG: hypothetical protein F9K33_07510 [bacterium]